jgi:hypothetical protein
MKHVIVGAHLRREDVEPAAVPLAAGDLFLSGLAVADDQPLGDRDLLLRVAATRGELLDRATFIAIRYGFAAGSETEAAAKCAPYLAKWKRILEENRDRVEMTLKVVAASPKPRPDRRDFTSGADYLRALQTSSDVDVDPAFSEAAEREIDGIRRRWIARDGASRELVALVSRHDVARVCEAGRLLKRAFPRVPFLLSGPWPLEVFADDDHE